MCAGLGRRLSAGQDDLSDALRTTAGQSGRAVQSKCRRAAAGHAGHGEAMKHAGPATLARVLPLLEQLRARTVLREPRPGVFYLKSRAFLHFHDDPSGVFADVRLADDFVRLQVTSSSQQADLLERIDHCLSSVESRSVGRRGSPRHGRPDDAARQRPRRR